MVISLDFNDYIAIVIVLITNTLGIIEAFSWLKSISKDSFWSVLIQGFENSRLQHPKQGWKNTQIVREHVRVLVLVLEQEQNKNMKNFGYWEQEQNENKNIEVKNNKFLDKEKYNICQAHFPTDFVSIECVWSTVDRLLMHEDPFNPEWMKSKVVGLGSKWKVHEFMFYTWK